MTLLHPVLRHEDQIKRIGILKLFTRHLDWSLLESGLKAESLAPLIVLLFEPLYLLHPEVHLEVERVRNLMIPLEYHHVGDGARIPP